MTTAKLHIFLCIGVEVREEAFSVINDGRSSRSSRALFDCRSICFEIRRELTTRRNRWIDPVWDDAAVTEKSFF